MNEYINKWFQNKLFFLNFQLLTLHNKLFFLNLQLLTLWCKNWTNCQFCNLKIGFCDKCDTNIFSKKILEFTKCQQKLFYTTQ